MHEYTASTTFGAEGEYQHAVDVMLGAAADLNIHPAIRQQALDVFILNIGDRLESYGIRHDFYVTGPANISVPVFTQSGTGARFAESARRVASQLVKLTSVLETARDDDSLYELIENARAEFINSTEDIVITDATTTINRTYLLVYRENGTVVQVPVEFIETPTIANLTRARPEAYLIPRTWSDIAEKLEILGLEIETLDYDYHGTVEAMTITNSTLAQTLYEGHVLNTVATNITMKEVHLPAGSFLVSTRQKNAALAFAVLEPESPDSYVTFNFIPLDINDLYPVFRVMAE
ncbi:hypothetical protein Slin14017_G067920 [Septoria linicola]|nr:hypothetical protein Slin14017_G067920 [Septoria linicola]